MRRDNRGISLVEIMLVIAILAVLGGVGIWGINTLTGRKAQQCSQKIVYSLERHRTTAMGKANAQYWLKVNGDGKVCVEERVTNDASAGWSVTTTEIGSAGVKVKYTLDTDSIPKDISVDPLKLEFDRSSGAFKTQDGGGYCNEIYVSHGGKEFNITLVPLTGKVYIK